MANSVGKEFEKKIKEQWKETVPNSFIFRLNDQMSGYMSVSRNPSDFIAYKKPNMFLIEAKSIRGNTFSVAFRQYDELIKYKDIEGLIAGVVLWFIEHDKIVWIPITTFEKLREDGKKSFNVKMTEENEYDYFIIPSKKLRTFMKSDYNSLVKHYDEVK